MAKLNLLEEFGLEIDLSTVYNSYFVMLLPKASLVWTRVVVFMIYFDSIFWLKLEVDEKPSATNATFLFTKKLYFKFNGISIPSSVAFFSTNWLAFEKLTAYVS